MAGCDIREILKEGMNRIIRWTEDEKQRAAVMDNGYLPGCQMQ